MANLLLSVMGAFAEFERALIRERQREGIALAKQRGAYRGRKRALSDADIAIVKSRVVAGDTKTQIARDFGISRETLYQYLRISVVNMAVMKVSLMKPNCPVISIWMIRIVCS